MMRSCVLAICVFVGLASQVFALDSTLVVPQLVKPASAPATDDPFKAKYESAWSRYEEAIAKVTDTVNKALDGLFNKAADAGNLDLADMWDKKKKRFADTRSIEWPADGKAKTEWRKKFPDIDFPEDFSEVIKAAQAGYAAAVTGLKSDYEGLVKDYTKERNLGRAKQLRDEVAGLERTPLVQPERPRTIESKPKPEAKDEPRDHVAEKPKDGKYVFLYNDGTGWGMLLEKKGDMLLICGDVNPAKPNGVFIWPKPRAVTYNIVGKTLVCDDRSPAYGWPFLFSWDLATGEAMRQMDAAKVGDIKRGVIGAKAW